MADEKNENNLNFMRKFISGALFVIASIAIISCSPNPTSGGKKLSEWKEQLKDSNNEYVFTALDAISKINPNEIELVKGDLRNLSTNHSDKAIRLLSAIIYANAYGYDDRPSIEQLILVASKRMGDYSIFSKNILLKDDRTKNRALPIAVDLLVENWEQIEVDEIQSRMDLIKELITKDNATVLEQAANKKEAIPVKEGLLLRLNTWKVANGFVVSGQSK